MIFENLRSKKYAAYTKTSLNARMQSDSVGVKTANLAYPDLEEVLVLYTEFLRGIVGGQI